MTDDLLNVNSITTTDFLGEKDLIFVMQAHQTKPRKPSKAFRKWDVQTPYFLHPIWCASTITTETTLELATRKRGAKVLLYHDVSEDTLAGLPDWLDADTKRDIADMTFEGSKEEMSKIWDRPPHIKLFKLYDKVSNLLDGVWMDAEKKAKYIDYTNRLRDFVEGHYGALNITRMAKGIS
jgi:hypothetical protein